MLNMIVKVYLVWNWLNFQAIPSRCEFIKEGGLTSRPTLTLSVFSVFEDISKTSSWVKDLTILNFSSFVTYRFRLIFLQKYWAEIKNFSFAKIDKSCELDVGKFFSDAVLGWAFDLREYPTKPWVGGGFRRGLLLKAYAGLTPANIQTYRVVAIMIV